MRKSLQFGLITALALLTTAGEARATSPDQHLADSTLTLSELIVRSGSLPSSRLSTTGGVISLEQIRQRQPQTSAHLVSLHPAVFMQRSQLAGGSPMIRGMATNRLLYLIDGVRFNTAIYRAGNIQNILSVDPATLQQISITAGVGSTLHGSDALGGVIDMRSLALRYAPSGKSFTYDGFLSGQYSSAHNGHSDMLQARLGGKQWAMAFSLGILNLGDLRQGSHGPKDYLKPYIVGQEGGKEVSRPNPDPRIQSPSGYNQLSLMGKIGYRPSEHLELQYILHHSKTGDYPRYDRHLRLRKGAPRYARWDYGPQLWTAHIFALSARPELLVADSIGMRIALQHNQESRIDRALNSSKERTQLEQVTSLSANLDLSKQIGALSLNYGAEWVSNHIISNGTSTDLKTHKVSSIEARYPMARWQSLGAYAQMQYRLSERLMMSLGGRYSLYQLRADFSSQGSSIAFAPLQTMQAGNVSGQLGLEWRVCEPLTLGLTMGRGYRMPNVDDMGKLYDPIDGGVVVPNASLHPELAHSLELRAAYRKGWLSMSLSAYRTWLSDVLVLRPSLLADGTQMTTLYRGTSHRVFQLTNSARGWVHGVELGLDIRPIKSLHIALAGAWQKGQEQADDLSWHPLRHVAPANGRLAIGYTLGKLTLEASAEGALGMLPQHIAPGEHEKKEIYALTPSGKVYVPSYLTANLNASYLLMNRLRLSIGLENIGDVRYRPYSSGISAPGRSLTAGISYRLGR